MAGRFASTATLALTAWSLVGCYAYVPVVAPVVPATESAVRLTLTPAGTEFLKPVLGANVRQLEGTVSRTTPDTVVMNVLQTVTTSQESFASNGITVAVPRQMTEEVASRQYAKRQSVLVVLAIAATLILAIAGISNSASTSGSPQPGTTQP